MQGIERAYCNVSISALTAAGQALSNAKPVIALRKTRYGKGDTLGLDAFPEIIISKRLKEYDGHSILITEELGRSALSRWPNESDPVKQPLMFFSDPTDRSKFLKDFFDKISAGNSSEKIGYLMKKTDAIKIWEDLGGAPAIITGATSSITCVRKGEIVFSVILNYITQTIFVATDIGVFQYSLPPYDGPVIKKIDLDYIAVHGKTLIFPSSQQTCGTTDNCQKFVTFLGKSGYQENFNDSMIFVDNPNDFLHHKEPGGPARIFYLSELQKNHGPIGFILANGEKIGEWIHWLAFAKFARNQYGFPVLKVFEINIERPWVKDGVLMSPPPVYSIFCDIGGKTLIDVSRLRYFDNPSRFRSMLVVTPADNEIINCVMNQHNYREINLVP